jgi:hypothetical protein
MKSTKEHKQIKHSHSENHKDDIYLSSSDKNKAAYSKISLEQIN